MDEVFSRTIFASLSNAYARDLHVITKIGLTNGRRSMEDP